MSESPITCPCGLPRPHPADGSRCWHPRYLADATDPRFTDGQRAQLARFEAAPAAPESFDPVAALRRVEALAEAIRFGEVGPLTQDFVAFLIRVAVTDSAAAAMQP